VPRQNAAVHIRFCALRQSVVGKSGVEASRNAGGVRDGVVDRIARKSSYWLAVWRSFQHRSHVVATMLLCKTLLRNWRKQQCSKFAAGSRAPAENLARVVDSNGAFKVVARGHQSVQLYQSAAGRNEGKARSRSGRFRLDIREHRDAHNLAAIVNSGCSICAGPGDRAQVRPHTTDPLGGMARSCRIAKLSS
jgi:hypothetical protein